MRKRLKTILISALVGISLVGNAQGEDQWKTYINGRWGFSLTYPSSLIAGPSPTNGAGQEFHLSSKEVSVAAQGSHTHEDIGETLDHFWRKELSERGDTVTYKLKKDNYYVISGVNSNGYQFYHKVFFFPGRWIEFEITYPHAKNKVYDAWVERIAREFDPSLPDNGAYDR
jgi:hypothetical protein